MAHKYNLYWLSFLEEHSYQIHQFHLWKKELLEIQEEWTILFCKYLDVETKYMKKVSKYKYEIAIIRLLVSDNKFSIENIIYQKQKPTIFFKSCIGFSGQK